MTLQKIINTMRADENGKPKTHGKQIMENG
jgi:hypothetical protein